MNSIIMFLSEMRIPIRIILIVNLFLNFSLNFVSFILLCCVFVRKRGWEGYKSIYKLINFFLLVITFKVFVLLIIALFSATHYIAIINFIDNSEDVKSAVKYKTWNKIKISKISQIPVLNLSAVRLDCNIFFYLNWFSEILR